MFKKTYLSRAMTKALSLDAPIGDPFGGPAFGERNEPVTAFFAVATAFETIAAVGTVISVVGLVTGNSSLTKIGGVIGLVGGFGTMAQSGMFGGGMQEWAQSVNQSFGTSTAHNISSAAVPTDAFANGEVVTQSIAGGAPTPGLIDAGSLNLEQATSMADTSGMLAPPDIGPIADTADMIASEGAIADGVAPGAPAVTPLDISKVGEPIKAMQAAAQQGGNLNAVAKAAGGGIDTGISLFDRISNFANKNKALTEMALKGVAGMYVSPQDKALKDAQISLYDTKTAEIQGQVANANAQPDVSKMFSTNPNAQIYKPKPNVVAAGIRPAGLIQTRSA